MYLPIAGPVGNTREEVIGSQAFPSNPIMHLYACTEAFLRSLSPFNAASRGKFSNIL